MSDPVHSLTQYSLCSLGTYASLAAYFSNFGTRITSLEQIAAMTSFADKNTGLFGTSDATLRSIMRTAQYELYWDSKYLSNITSIVNKKVNGGAVGAPPIGRLAVGLSVFLLF